MTANGETTLIPIFDGHNDTILDLAESGRSFYERGTSGHLDRVRAAEGGMAGGFFAIWTPDFDSPHMKTDWVKTMIGRGLEGVPVVSDLGSPSLAYAQQFTNAMIARLLRIEAGDGAELVLDESLDIEVPRDGLSLVYAAADLEDNVDEGVFSAILHFEGAEMIDENLYALDTYYAAGLRSLGIVWSRSNIFAHGVPFAFGESPDTGPGLTDLGKALVTRCNELGIMIDLSHLNEQGFWDVAELTDAPLVATHSNAWALCPSTRNLTDKQLDAIAESDGIVGVNFNCGFLRPDGGRDTDTPLTIMADHVDYLVNRIGIDRVALGSDFDGALMPNELADASMLPNLVAVLRERGYDDESLRKIGYQNWVRVLEETWGF
jgi:membrane dipeptidase